mmetsp:Transcript_4490/g.11280  ORF Transcript_4490/g.11280 Transcript_4490/m.11280 type:complete len:360 (+) Transcript_4490:108-1187(+)
MNIYRRLKKGYSRRGAGNQRARGHENARSKPRRNLLSKGQNPIPFMADSTVSGTTLFGGKTTKKQLSSRESKFLRDSGVTSSSRLSSPIEEQTYATHVSNSSENDPDSIVDDEMTSPMKKKIGELEVIEPWLESSTMTIVGARSSPSSWLRSTKRTTQRPRVQSIIEPCVLCDFMSMLSIDSILGAVEVGTKAAADKLVSAQGSFGRPDPTFRVINEVAEPVDVPQEIDLRKQFGKSNHRQYRRSMMFRQEVKLMKSPTAKRTSAAVEERESNPFLRIVGGRRKRRKRTAGVDRQLLGGQGTISAPRKVKIFMEQPSLPPPPSGFRKSPSLESLVTLPPELCARNSFEESVCNSIALDT